MIYNICIFWEYFHYYFILPDGQQICANTYIGVVGRDKPTAFMPHEALRSFDDDIASANFMRGRFLARLRRHVCYHLFLHARAWFGHTTNCYLYIISVCWGKGYIRCYQGKIKMHLITWHNFSLHDNFQYCNFDTTALFQYFSSFHLMFRYWYSCRLHLQYAWEYFILWCYSIR